MPFIGTITIAEVGLNHLPNASYKLNQPEDAKGQVILYPLTPVTFPPGVPTFSLFIDDSVSSFNKIMATALPAFHL